MFRALLKVAAMRITTQIKILQVCLFLVFNQTILAKQKVAIINYTDSYTNIRTGPGNKFPVAGRLKKMELFYCSTPENSDWIKVLANQWENDKQIEGYVQKTSIQLLEDLDSASEFRLIADILRHEMKMNDPKYPLKEGEHFDYHDRCYDPVLDELPSYFGKTRCVEILDLFIKTLLSEPGSADEANSRAIAACFVREPEIVCNQIRKVNTSGRVCTNLINHIEFGLRNYFWVSEKDDGSKNPELAKLIKRLNVLKKKVGYIDYTPKN